MSNVKLRVWTVEEVNALVPQLSALVGRQLALAGEIDDRLERLQRSSGVSNLSRADLQVVPGDASEVRELKRALLERISAYEAGWKSVESLGAVVKDPRMGLCDFYGHVDGKLVWLCWRYDEPEIGYYHDLDSGFRGRKALTAETRQRLLN